MDMDDHRETISLKRQRGNTERREEIGKNGESNREREHGRRRQRFVVVNAWTIASGLTEVTPTSSHGKQMRVDLRGYGREDNGEKREER